MPVKIPYINLPKVVAKRKFLYWLSRNKINSPLIWKF